MAEMVERKMEVMSEELDELLKQKILETERVRKILKNRKDFEYKLSGLTKHLHDYKAYILHEESLLDFINRQKLRHNYKCKNAEQRIFKRIKNLYETAIQRFPNDLPFCMSYLQFTKKYKVVSGTASAIHFLTCNHPKNPDVWCIAARYYYFNKKDPKTAFTMLHKGISFNKNSPELYQEIVQMEIYQVMGAEDEVKVEQSKELEEKQEVCLKALSAYIKTMFKNITHGSFYTDLLSLLVKYKFTIPIQNEIIKELLENYYQKPEIWDYLARREYEGHHYSDASTSSHKLKSSSSFEKYKEGLMKVPESAKQEMWNKCIDFLIEINMENYSSSSISKAKFLLEAYQQASEENYLSADHYISWIDYAKDISEKYAIAEKGTIAYPHSTDLWRQRFYLKQDIVFGTPMADAEMREVFELGIKALENDSAMLWNGMLRYYLLSEKFDLLESLYVEGIKQAGAVGKDLKARYITHLNLNKGIEAARAAYREIALLKPYCKELHEAMWRAESTELEFNFAEWENVHKLAVEQFGKEDVDVWIDYLRFYVLHNHNLKKEIVEDIMQKALESLPEHLKWDFQGKYNQLQNLVGRDS